MNYSSATTKAYAASLKTPLFGLKKQLKVIKVKKVKITGAKTVEVGKTVKLKAVISPSKATKKKVIWTSSNKKIATVSASGKVMGKKAGTVTITAKATDKSKKKGTFRIKVIAAQPQLDPSRRLERSEALFFAHAGYSTVEPANTIPAFQAAVDAGFHGIECDIWEVQDLKFMVFHDRNLLGMTGANLFIDGLTREQIADYPVIYGNNIDRYGSLPISTFEEYLDVFTDNDLIPMIEIKQESLRPNGAAISKEAARELLRLIAERGFQQQVFITAFNHNTLLVILEVWEQDYPEIHLGTLFNTSNPNDVTDLILEQYRDEGITGFNISTGIATPEAIKSIHDNGLKVGVWTVAKPALAYDLVKNDEVDFITSKKAVFK